MQHSGKWNTTSQILKPKNIKLRDINGLTSSQIKKMSVRCRSQENMLGLTTQHDSQARLCFSLLSWRRCLDTIGMSRQLPVTTARHPASGETPNLCQSPLFFCAQRLDHFITHPALVAGGAKFSAVAEQMFGCRANV